MTFVEMYEAQPKEVQALIEAYASNFNWAQDCFDTLLSLCPQKECSIRALAEAYAVWYHQQATAEDSLKELGYDDAAITQLGYGYQLKYREK